MSQDFIKQEQERRLKLAQITSRILDQHYQFGQGRIKRGAVHKSVALALRVELNNVLVGIIKDVLEARGAASTCSRGTLYYRGLCEREGRI